MLQYYNIFKLQLCCSVQSLSCVRLFATPWTAACQASLSITNSWSLFKLLFHLLGDAIQPSHLLQSCPLFLLPSIFLRIRVFSSELVLHIRWPKYWSFSIDPSNEYSGLIMLRSTQKLGFPDGASGKEPDGQCRRHKRCRFSPWIRKIPWRRAWQSTTAFLPGDPHGERSLVGSMGSQRVGHD